ncbi:unnamed protein product [Arctia plantaginis]|uniref:Reverse transcriptase domain-containing protein n=1 Tax=Arctia plantaginis TaxID=874455 RepID=A0A8S0ZW19_ARCPL|nr:unnamed protein product [Arctia plantaginis]
MQASPIKTVLERCDSASPAQNAVEPEQDTMDPTMEPPLELLSALGASTSATPEFGANVHDSVANLWTPILKKGLPSEEKDKLVKEYLPPGNCTLLQAPKLNAEISAAATDMVKGRDKKLLKFQQQLGVGTAAIGRGIDTLLKSNNKVLALTQISDGCRFLTDLHYLLSKDRIKLVSHGLEKNFLTVIQDAERDETLFGNSLSERIKASLAISKQSAQIKATTNQRAGINPMQSHITRPSQGNWSGPPRYPTNRGGAGRSAEVNNGSTTTPGLSTSCSNTIKSAQAVQATCSSTITQAVIQISTPNCDLSYIESFEMLEAINKLLDLGAISRCIPSHGQFISKTFLAPKPDGSKRVILNLKPLNKFVEKTHFKMEDYRTAVKLIPKGGYLATIDLKEAFLLVPITESDRKYLRFNFRDPISNKLITYEFNAMPYGLSVAPRVFTKIMKEVIAYLRKQGHKSVVYLDDMLCIGNNYDVCLTNVQETLRLLECLGFIVNYTKSLLTPSQKCKFLGFLYNTENLTLSLPPDKRHNIRKLIQKYSRLPRCTIRDYAQLIGVLIAACPAVRYGFLYTKILERQKFILLQQYNHNYEAKLNLPKCILDDLNWWLKNILTTSCPMRTIHHKKEIFTDASRTGWGAVCNEEKISGNWRTNELEHHINYLELLAAFLGLKSFASDEKNSTILLRIDNTTAISYINRMGGIQFPHLNDLTRSIWQWCEKRNIWLFASYVNTKENCADAESRKINPDTEWNLSDKAFGAIIQHFGYPEIDLFASRSNAKCKMFASWKQEPDSYTVDAFTINWQLKYFYAFPPFSLILKCLRKIIDDKATESTILSTTNLPWVSRDYPDSIHAPRHATRDTRLNASIPVGQHR